MIVSPGRGYVFVHIPKTGGTSMALALENRARKDDLMLGDTPKALKRRRRLAGRATRGRLWKHSTLADIDGLLPEGTLESLFAFTLVRNPWDRALSYYHWLRDQRFDHPAVARAHRLGFSEFVTHPDTLAAYRANPASHYMRRADGVEQCHAYIRLEAFEEDAAPLFDHLGFRFDLPHANRTARKGDGYTPQSAEAIAEACAEDIARFGYSFG